MTWFARALGAARSNDAVAARASVDTLKRLQERLVAEGERYWAEQVEIQRRGASAWASMAEGRASDALAEMRSAADREDLTEKNAVTPGPLAPARELLGDMLIAMREPAAGAGGIRGRAEEGAEPVPHGLRRRPRRGARRQPREGA